MFYFFWGGGAGQGGISVEKIYLQNMDGRKKFYFVEGWKQLVSGI